ncbi:hypothetical protein Salat_2436300 [Sesamum alatum]|uniref:Uncharacterized protein n=1 Tax=Sesamum alatum TaxID=300844 RepID=A0AAE1XY44_9LAMI|nr:hypothetical protein Salat_2436300 [Sesamum alatum]
MPMAGGVAAGRGRRRRYWPRRFASAKRAWPQPAAPVAVGCRIDPPLSSSFALGLGGVVDFQDEVIEAIRNPPESHSDSLEISVGSDLSPTKAPSPILSRSGELESFVAP